VGFLRNNTSPWYWGYAFQGLVVLGFLPILLPLFTSRMLSPASVGVVVAAVYAGQLTAPILGSLAEKWKCYGATFLSGYGLIGAGFLGIVLFHSLSFWVLMAFLIGVGSAATNTIGGVYIVENFPKDSWDRRIGWMQTFYGAGQALGVFAMSIFSGVPVYAMGICAFAMIPGFLLSYWWIPGYYRKIGDQTIRGHSMVRHSLPGSQQYHQLRLRSFTHWVKKWDTPFTLYLASWFLLMLGTFMIYNLYPLLMESSYQIAPRVSSLFFAVGAGIGVAVYPISGIAAKRIGNNWVLLIGYLFTFASVFILGLCAYSTFSSILIFWLAALAVALLTIAWSPLIVGGTAEAATLSIVEEGEALGLFNATTAVASIIAAVMAGRLADSFSYNLVAIVSCFIVLFSLILFIPLLFREK